MTNATTTKKIKINDDKFNNNENNNETNFSDLKM